MFLAAHRVPSVWLILATLVGGALGGRVRERHQPVPGPRHRRDDEAHAAAAAALARSDARAGAALRRSCWGRFVVLLPGHHRELLAAELALSAIAFYVFVYTMWLKRTTTQNIVIGGAAGAVPALVGWAAVTGGARGAGVDPVRDHLRVDAAALLGAGDAVQGRLRRRGRAHAAGGQGGGGDPATDLPVLPGPVRDVPGLVPVGAHGPGLLLTALGLGGASSTGRCACGSTGDPARSWGLFKFSIWYLAALFGAVAVDALLPLSR